MQHGIEISTFHNLASLKCFNSARDVECLPKELSKATISCLVSFNSDSGLNNIFNAEPIPEIKLNYIHFR